MSHWLITFLASFLVWFMIASLFFLGYRDGKLKRELALHALLAGFIAWSTAQLIKRFYHTPRPFEINGHTPLTLFANPDGSFPSGHTALAFALATSVLLHHRHLGLIFITAALLVGTGRVLSNVHYPIDILAGAAIGTTTALLLHQFHRFYPK